MIEEFEGLLQQKQKELEEANLFVNQINESQKKGETGVFDELKLKRIEKLEE